MSQPGWITALVWLVPAVWSTNYLIARIADAHVTPHVLAFGRWAIVAAILLVWARAELQREWPSVKTEFGQSVVLGALGMSVCGAWLYKGAQDTVAMNIALIYATTPIGVVAASQWLLGERMSMRRAFSIAMALVGVVIVIVKGDVQALLRLQFNKGDPWVVACAVAWMLYSLLLKRWPSKVSATARLACICVGGLLTLLPGVLYELVSDPRPLSWQAVTLVLAAALFPGLIAYLAYSHIQAHLGAARTSLMLYLSPVYVALLAWLLLGEPLRWYHFVGAALILPGIHLATRSAPPTSSAQSPTSPPGPQRSTQTPP